MMKGIKKQRSANSRKRQDTRGEEVEYLGAVNPNPAIFNNLCHTYLVKNVRKVAETNFDPDEDIEVVLIPAKEVTSLIEKGKITHALVIIAFHFYFMKNHCLHNAEK
jgi:hypothetical protein